MPRMWISTASILICGLSLFLHPLQALGPQPGDIYREYSVDLKIKNNWRVTDPNSGQQGAGEFLPNPVLMVNISDLDGAARAEVLIDRWGGHPGTSGKMVRFNGRQWLSLPKLTTTPEGEEPDCYMSQDNPVIEVPLEHLREGANTFEGTCGDQVCFSFNWGQWGWYGIVLRVYYHQDKRHPGGRIAPPEEAGILRDFPTVKLEASSRVGISRVDFIGYYNGFDVDGDGVFTQWQRYYRGTSLTNHLGSALAEPWEVTWNTRWVPDQQQGAIKLIARIRDNNGIWFVTEALEGLTLLRDTLSVRMYRPLSVPRKFWVRDNREMSCEVGIPESEPLEQATEAAMHLRTWNGIDDNFVINDSFSGQIGGNDHFFKYSIRAIPPASLTKGITKISFSSPTEHHGTELLWPGPVIMVRYKVTD